MSDSSSERFAIARRESPRPDLLVFEVTASIARRDIDEMAQQVGRAFDSFERIDILIVMTVFAGADADAILDPKALAMETRALKQVRRYGVVGAPGWIRAMIEAADFIIPVDSKTFDERELDAAWRWIERP